MCNILHFLVSCDICLSLSESHVIFPLHASQISIAGENIA